eukprot:1193083-Rhodomonas_salina.1
MLAKFSGTSWLVLDAWRLVIGDWYRPIGPAVGLAMYCIGPPFCGLIWLLAPPSTMGRRPQQPQRTGKICTCPHLLSLLLQTPSTNHLIYHVVTEQTIPQHTLDSAARVVRVRGKEVVGV